MASRPAVYICGDESAFDASDVALDKRFMDCSHATDHAPFPVAMMGAMEIAHLRMKAGQRQRRCPHCGSYSIWYGGRDVPGWPRTMREVRSR